MIPISLRISGFTSYNERQPAEINLNDLELACISGPNGAGKSSLLDAITYALYGKARKADDSIINTASKRAEVSLDFAYEGQVYRVIRALQRGKSTQLDFYIQTQQADADSPAKWRTLTKHSVKETDREIESTLRLDYDSFVNASFFLQGKADSFATQRPAERKRILSSILGLDQWEIYRDAAARRRAQRNEALILNEACLKDVQRELDQEEERRQRLSDLESKRELINEKLRAEQATLELQQANRERLRVQRENLALLERQAKTILSNANEIEEKLAERQMEMQALQAKLDRAAEIEAASQSYQTVREQLTQVEALAQAAQPLEQELQKLQAELLAKTTELSKEAELLEAQRLEVQEKQAAGSALDKELARIEIEMEALQRVVGRREALEAELTAAESSLAALSSEEKNALQLGKQSKERKERLLDIAGAACPLCGQPLNEHDRERLIAELNEECDSLRQRIIDLRKQRSETDARKQSLLAERSQLGSDEKKLQSLQVKTEGLLQQVHAAAAEFEAWNQNKLPRLQKLNAHLQNQDYLPELRARSKELETQLQELGYDVEVHRMLRQAEVQGRDTQAALEELKIARSRVQSLQTAIQEDEHNLKRQKKLYEQANADTDKARIALAAAEAGLPDIRQTQETVFALQEDLAESDRQLGAARQMLNAIATQREHQAQLNAEGEEIRAEIADLRSLEKAFGKDGVPAMLIEQELPELEREANELLQRLSNYSMSVQFATQREYKNPRREDKRETLDIIISDGSATRDYETYSGGEAFRINFAIRVALSKILAQRAGARLQTLVIDEGFGNQDLEGRQRLIEAINIVKDDFALILIITHIEELKEQFPARIEVSKNAVGSVVEVIPG
jgi:exonuclease SbcC